MALILSTGLRQALAQQAANVKGAAYLTDLTFLKTAVAASYDTILSTANNFIADSFASNDALLIFQSVNATWDGDGGDIQSIDTSGTRILLPFGSLTASGAGGNRTALIAVSTNGGSMKDVFRNSVIHVYSGSAPTTADAAETGTLLLKITKSSGAFVAGQQNNGFNFGTAVAGVLSKDSDTYSGLGLQDGTAGYYRQYDNAETTGSSTTAIRMQGTAGTSGSQLILSSTSITTGATVTLDQNDMTIPAT